MEVSFEIQGTSAKLMLDGSILGSIERGPGDTRWVFTYTDINGHKAETSCEDDPHISCAVWRYIYGIHAPDGRGKWRPALTLFQVTVAMRTLAKFLKDNHRVESVS